MQGDVVKLGFVVRKWIRKGPITLGWLTWCLSDMPNKATVPQYVFGFSLTIQVVKLAEKTIATFESITDMPDTRSS